MPFDKKLACLTNHQERRSFPWPLVQYTVSTAPNLFDKSFIAASFHETDEEEEESPYNSDMDEEDEISTNLSTNQSAGGFKSTAKMRGMLSRVLETRSSGDRSQVMANLKQKLGSQISLKRMSRENLAGL